jgi:tRNA (Thr-GGU) A37 N-methylase
VNSQPYEVVPIGWVESPLADLAQAPCQGNEGAPSAWLVFEPPVSEGIRDLQAGERIIVLTWLDRARRDVLSTIHEATPTTPCSACSAPARPTGLTRSACTGSRSSPSRARGSWCLTLKLSMERRSST